MKQLLIFVFMISVQRLIKIGRIFAWSDRIYAKSKLVKMMNCIFHLNSVKLFCRYGRFDLWDCLHGFFIFCFSTFFLFGKICERKLLGKRIPNPMEKISKSLAHGSDKIFRVWLNPLYLIVSLFCCSFKVTVDSRERD